MYARCEFYRFNLFSTEIGIRCRFYGKRKPKIFVYTDSEQIRSAVLFTQEWTGALVFWDYNIILIPVELRTLDWSKRTLAHETTHLMVREATFGPFGDIPTWLNEGLATCLPLAT